MIKRRKFLKRSLVGSAVTLSAARNARPASRRRPNVLFLMVDEMRWDCLGVAGHPTVRTPNLDALAHSGCHFTRTYTVSPRCSPARMSLFTGRYRQAHGVVKNELPGHPGEVTLPLILQRNGYRTGMAGKIHLRGPGSAGIEWYRMFMPGDPAFPPNGQSYGELIKQKYPVLNIRITTGQTNIEGIPETLEPDPNKYRIGTAVLSDQEYQTAWAADKTIEFLKERARDDAPWFFHCSLLHPHGPWIIPDPYATMYKPEEIKPPKLTPEMHAMIKAKLAAFTNPGQGRRFILDSAYLQRLLARYYGCCTMVDAHFGRILKVVDELGMRDNTIIVFTSDHGDMMGDQGRVFKGCMYEGSTHIPLIVRLPGLPHRQRLDELIEITDIMPTVLECCGLPVAEGIQGRSFLNLMQGTEEQWKNTVFSDLEEKMMIEGRYKLMTEQTTAPKNRQENWEFYDLIEDPKETRNLANEPEHADRIAAMKQRLEEKLAERPPAVNLEDCVI